MNKFVNKYLGDGEFWRASARLAVPIALQNLLMSSFSLVDTLMIGQLGDVALSSVGMACQWSWLLGLVLFGLNSGSSVFFAQYWGIRDVKKIHNVFGITLTHVLGAAAVFAAVGFFAPGGVVGLFSSEQPVIEAGTAYLSIAVWSYFGVALNNAFSTLLRSTEEVRLPMYASLASTLLNAVLNYALIFGKFGCPALGIRGAAIATVIASWVAPAVMLIVSMKRGNMLMVKLSELRFDRALLMRFYRISSPVILNESMWGLGTMLYNVIFGRLGYEYYAAVTILRTIEGIAFVFFVGLCSASSVIVGKKIGCGEIEEAKADALRFAVIIPSLGVLVGAAVIALRPAIMAMYTMSGNITELTVATAMGIFLVYGLELGMRQVPYILIVGVFRAGGDTATGMKYDILNVWCVALPMTALAAFVFKWPFVAVFATMLICEDTFKTFLCIRHFAQMKWIKPLTTAELAENEQIVLEDGGKN